MSVLSNACRRLLTKYLVRGKAPSTLNAWQEAFCRWNAERLGIDLHESYARHRRSWAALRGGYGGNNFRALCELTHEVHEPFYSDARAEVYEAYRMHAPLHFMRMLGCRIPSWPEYLPEIKQLLEKPSALILDFGCGLAQKSISLAQYIQRQGHPAELHLADIPTIRMEFLKWYCARLKIPMVFGECMPARPIPPLPRCDLCIASEVFEHLYEPLRYLNEFHEAIRTDGLLLTNVADHRDRLFHVSPKLEQVRARLKELGYQELRPNVLFQKR